MSAAGIGVDLPGTVAEPPFPGESLRGGVGVHASCVVVGEDGILIRGPAGSGKSTLARELIDEAARRGLHGKLVSDDRTRLSAQGGRLVARPVPVIAGLLEIRAIGLTDMPHLQAAVVRLVVDCTTRTPPRYPLEETSVVCIENLVLPRVFARITTGSAACVLVALQASRGRKNSQS